MLMQASTGPAIYQGVNISSTTTVTIPTHAPGYLIVIFAVASSTSLPSVPTASGTVPAWAAVNSLANSQSMSSRTASFVATASNHTSGTWTGAGGLMAVVVSGVKQAAPIGGHGITSGSTFSDGGSVAPAITMTHTDGSSVLLELFSVSETDSWPNAAPTGYTKRLGSGVLSLDTKDNTTSDGSVTQSCDAAVFHRSYHGAAIEVVSH